VKAQIPDDGTIVNIPNEHVLIAAWKNEADNSSNFSKIEFDKFDFIQLGRNSNGNDDDMDTDSISTNITGKRKKSAKLSIYTCLDKFCEREQLADEETLYCSQCKEHVAPLKKIDLWATPDILTIQLKRFQYIPGQYFVHR
jgi:hypothetical protein